MLVPMCRKFGNVRRFWRGRKEMEFTYLVKLSNPCRTPKSIVDRELIFVYFIRIQQGTRKVLWIRHHVLLKTKAKDVSTANQRTESQSSKPNFAVALWRSGWLWNTWRSSETCLNCRQPLQHSAATGVHRNVHAASPEQYQKKRKVGGKATFATPQVDNG